MSSTSNESERSNSKPSPTESIRERLSNKLKTLKRFQSAPGKIRNQLTSDRTPESDITKSEQLESGIIASAPSLRLRHSAATNIPSANVTPINEFWRLELSSEGDHKSSGADSRGYLKEYIDKNSHLLSTIADAILDVSGDVTCNDNDVRLIDVTEENWEQDHLLESLIGTLRMVLRSLGQPFNVFTVALQLHIKNLRHWLYLTCDWNRYLDFIEPLLALNYRNEGNFINAFDSGCGLIIELINSWEKELDPTRLHEFFDRLLFKCRMCHNEISLIAFETALYIISYLPMSRRFMESIEKSRTETKGFYSDKYILYRQQRVEYLRVLTTRVCDKYGFMAADKCIKELKASLRFEPNLKVQAKFDSLLEYMNTTYQLELSSKRLWMFSTSSRKLARWRSTLAARSSSISNSKKRNRDILIKTN